MEGGEARLALAGEDPEGRGRGGKGDSKEIRVQRPWEQIVRESKRKRAGRGLGTLERRGAE